MKTLLLTVLFAAFALVAIASDEKRPNLLFSTNDINPKSVRIHGDAPNVNVMFRFRNETSPHIYDFYRENFAKWIQVTVDGVLVSEKAGHAPIVSGGRFVGYDVIVATRDEAERLAKVLRGEK